LRVFHARQTNMACAECTRTRITPMCIFSAVSLD
jgi:hypothetical protein